MTNPKCIEIIAQSIKIKQASFSKGRIKADNKVDWSEKERTSVLYMTISQVTKWQSHISRQWSIVFCSQIAYSKLSIHMPCHSILSILLVTMKAQWSMTIDLPLWCQILVLIMRVEMMAEFYSAQTEQWWCKERTISNRLRTLLLDEIRNSKLAWIILSSMGVIRKQKITITSHLIQSILSRILNLDQEQYAVNCSKVERNLKKIT